MKLNNESGFFGTLIAIGSAILGGGLAGGALLSGGAALGAGLIGGATLLAGGLAITGLARSVFGGSGQEALPSAPAALPAAPTFEEAQRTSLEEQRDVLRRKSRTTLTTTNLLETTGETTKKTLLGG